MKNLRKYLGTTTFAFLLAFMVAGTPSAPAATVVPSSGEAHAARVGYVIAGWIAGGIVWDGVKWLANLPWGAAFTDMCAAHGALVRSGQGHLLVLDAHSTSALYDSAQ